jgi:UDP-galactose transporter B1
MTHRSTHQKFAQETWSKRAWNAAICIGGIFVCFFIFGIYQEKITQQRYGEKDRFVYMQALVFVLFVVNTLVALVGVRTRGHLSSDNVPFRLYAICSVFYFLAVFSSNFALKWVNYPTQVLGKSCKPIPVMLFGVIFAHKRYHLRKYFYVLSIVAGMALFLYKDEHASQSDLFQFGSGELLLLGSLLMDGFTGATQDRIRHGYITDKWSMMFYMNLFATIFLGVSLTVTGELNKFFAFVQQYPYIVREMLLFSITGALGQCFIFKTITDLGPLTLSIITTVRKLASLVFSIVFFGHPYTSRQMVAISIVFAALFLDVVDSKRSHSNASNGKSEKKEKA